MYIETTCISMYESMNLCIYLLTGLTTVCIFASMHLSQKFSSMQTPSASMNECIYAWINPTNGQRIHAESYLTLVQTKIQNQIASIS